MENDWLSKIGVALVGNAPAFCDIGQVAMTPRSAMPERSSWPAGVAQ